MTTQADVAVQIIVKGDSKDALPLVSAERRITLSWTIAQLKGKLEPVTGVPASAQTVRTKDLSGNWHTIDDEHALLGDSRWSIRKGSEIEIIDTRPASARQNFNDVSVVEKYQMPEPQYEQLSDSVLAWKRRQKLGRFDPNAKSAATVIEERRIKDEEEIKSKDIKAADRCRVGGDDGRRGTVRFVGAIEGLGGEREAGCLWIGVELDEPVGRNDGSVQVEWQKDHLQVRRIFECKDKFGIFARPEKVETGDWPPLDDLEIDEDMEEI